MRANSESSVNSRSAVRFGTETAQVSELLRKVLYHNLCALVGATFEASNRLSGQKLPLPKKSGTRGSFRQYPRFAKSSA
jgi:hypothetical protein